MLVAAFYGVKEAFTVSNNNRNSRAPARHGTKHVRRRRGAKAATRNGEAARGAGKARSRASAAAQPRGGAKLSWYQRVWQALCGTSPARSSAAPAKSSARHERRVVQRLPLAQIAVQLDQSQPLPWIISNRCHPVSRRNISSAAVKVLNGLKDAGYDAYLVGGGVRDILLGMYPKDFDVVTNAYPEQVKKVFKNCRLIGRRFRLAHVYFRREIIEVSTFRAAVDTSEVSAVNAKDAKLVQSDNIYGTIEEDAWRRDFSVNAIYYNIKDHTLVDYTGGLRDLKQGVVRVLGDPRQRFHEDPVRMLRAVRIAAKMNFTIEESAGKELRELAPLLEHVPEARIFDEVVKLLFHGHAVATYKMLHQYAYFKVLFPVVVESLQLCKESRLEKFLQQAIAVTDERYAQGKSLNPGFLLSVILWPVISRELQQYLATVRAPSAPQRSPLLATIGWAKWDELVRTVLARERKLRIPRRILEMVRDIWRLQRALAVKNKRSVAPIMRHRYFRAAVDFLQLQAIDQAELVELNDWWWQLREANHKQQEQMIADLPDDKKRRSRRRHRATPKKPAQPKKNDQS